MCSRDRVMQACADTPRDGQDGTSVSLLESSAGVFGRGLGWTASLTAQDFQITDPLLPADARWAMAGKPGTAGYRSGLQRRCWVMASRLGAFWGPGRGRGTVVESTTGRCRYASCD